MSSLNRTDRSLIAQWWWTIDRWSLISILLLMMIGAILVMAASPAVADRLGLYSFYFVERHLIMLPLALILLFFVSLMSPRGVRRLALALFVLSIVLTALTLIGGVDIKGAKRWLRLFDISVQPSELLKPTFIVTCAWLFARDPQKPGLRNQGNNNLMAIILFGLSLTILLLQPDLGMVILLGIIWIMQFFMAGLSLFWVGAFAVLGLGGLLATYFIFPHVASRINRFFNPEAGDNFQIEKSLDAFERGGIWGQGPGEGIVKQVLPDAHADFIFAVAGEEMGLIFCLILLCLFGFIVLRGCSRLMSETNPFIVLAASGLFIQFGLQALINVGSALNLVPTKGMTLPFVSYGGSSLLAMGVAMGMALALTRKRRGGLMPV